MPDRSDYWPEFPVILGFGSTHEMRDAKDTTVKSRLWDLKSTSKAACKAYDRNDPPKINRVAGFARKPKA